MVGVSKQTNGLMEQINGKEQEVHEQTHTTWRLIFNEDTKEIQWRKDSPFFKWTICRKVIYTLQHQLQTLTPNGSQT